jgi:multidrug efflux system membrane fusion protein
MKSTYVIAIVTAVILGLWLASGQLNTGTSNAAINESEDSRAAAITRVRTRVSQAQQHILQLAVSGKTEAKRSVQVRAETTGRVIEIPIEKGTVVEKGDLLCKLSMEDRDIKFEKAKAAVAHAELEHDGMLRLAQDGYQGEVNIASSRAKLINAKAERKSRALDLSNRNVKAPFRGIVEDRSVNVGDYIQRGEVCAEIIDPNPLLLVAHVSERELAGLSPGSVARARLSNGQEVKGPISFISHSADDITRTYRIDVEIDNADFKLRDGLSADVYLTRETVLAHRVSPAILSLSDTGMIGIKIVDNDSIVRFVEVDIVSDTEEGVWLSGLPDSIQLITVGQELVFAGQRVESVPVDTLTQVVQ